jgi:hypothetical protein
MSPVTSIFPGQSNTPLRAAQARATAPGARLYPMRNPPRSAEHIAGAATAASTLMYPHDTPKYYMHFGIYEYDRPSFTAVGSFNPWKGGSNEILMPLSESLQDNLEEKWEDKPIPWVIGGAAELLQGLKADPGKVVKDALAGAQQIAADALNNPFGSGTTLGAGLTRLAGTADATLGTSLGPAVGAKFGFAPNQFVTVLFIGPEYKQHMFSWNLSPRDPDESRTLNRIINVFKKSMSPTLRFGGLVWGYPCVYRILFRPNNELLYKFKPMCLKEFRVNWAPAGRPSFYREEIKDRGGFPEGVNITATFLEMEYWHQGAMNEVPLHDDSLTINNDELYGISVENDPTGGGRGDSPA